MHLYRPLEIAGIVFAWALVSGPALADSVSEFYAGPGKQMKIIIRDTTGSNYDMLSRLVARHMGAYIPGDPRLKLGNCGFLVLVLWRFHARHSC